MADTSQELLQRAWTQGRTGYLAAWSEAKAWALREVWRETHNSDHGLGTHVAGKLRKVGGGAPSGEAVMKLFRKIDADPEWFPGKTFITRTDNNSLLPEMNRKLISKTRVEKNRTLLPELATNLTTRTENKT